MASTIPVRVDDDLQTKSDALFKDLGTDTTTAIRMFLTQALAVNGVPFEIKRANTNPYEALEEHEILDKPEKSREHAAQEDSDFTGFILFGTCNCSGCDKWVERNCGCGYNFSYKRL